MSSSAPGSKPRHFISAGRDLCRVVRELNSHGWCQGTGGNFSTLLSRDPFQLLLTQSGKDKTHLDVEDLVIVDVEGKPVRGQTGKPSAETLIHCFLANEQGAGSVLHTHSVWNTLLGERFLEQGGFTLTGYEMLKGLEGVTTHEHREFIPVVANAQDMAAFTQKLPGLFASNPGIHGFLIAGHGLYTWGRNLEETLRHVEILEFLFELVGRRTRFVEFTG